jgi:hypothetical protein
MFPIIYYFFHISRENIENQILPYKSHPIIHQILVSLLKDYKNRMTK